MIKVKDIYDFLNERYPIDTACDFDNPGFLIGDGDAAAEKVLIALDCDIDAVNTARENGCNLIITHHPVIWSGLKSVTAGSIAFELIKSGISVISMHTNLDIAKDGVNRTLCDALELKNISAVTAADGFPLLCGEVSVSDPDKLAAHIKERLGFGVRYASSGKKIKKALVCCGSGGDFLNDALCLGCDALITADVKHNVFTDAINADISVFDAGHYASERVIIKPLCRLLENSFKDLEFIPYYSEKIKSI